MKKIDQWLRRNQFFALFVVVPFSSSFGFILGRWAADSWLEIWGNPIEHIINYINK